MNLEDLNNGAGAPRGKPWLRPVAASLEAVTLEAEAVIDHEKTTLIRFEPDSVNVTASLFTRRDVAVATVDDIAVLAARVAALELLVAEVSMLRATLSALTAR